MGPNGCVRELQPIGLCPVVLKLQRLEARDAEHARTEEELRHKIADLTTKNAALEERSRHQEKTPDRGWQLWLAALGFGFGLVSLLITAALQLKK